MLLAVAIAVTLSHAPQVLAGTNGMPPEGTIATTHGGSVACQTREAVPAGTVAMRLWIGVNIGPLVKVTVRAGRRIVTRGSREAGWTGEVVTVPVARVPRRVSNANICFQFGPALEEIWLVGAKTSPGEGGLVGGVTRGPSRHAVRRVLKNKMRIEYLEGGSTSWWSMAQAIIHRMGLGRSPGGDWVALVPLALMAAAVALAVRLLWRQLGGRRLAASPPIAGAAEPPVAAPAREPASAEPESVGGGGQDGGPPQARRRRGSAGGPTARGPRARGVRGLGRSLAALRRSVPAPARTCALVAILSAASWSIESPPFQIPDEPSHFGYVQQLVEAHALPNQQETHYAPAESVILEDLGHEEIRFNPAIGTISIPVQQRRLEADLARPLSRKGGSAGVASTQPPLYYALETVPYAVGLNGTLLDSLALMRLFSALLAGLTALFAYLFLREALPGVPWAWTVGGLGAALAPLLGFMSGAVNPDSMLAALSAATFYCLARAFRRGLTRRLAIAIGVVVLVGLLTKLNYIGLLPGVGLALALLARRAARSGGRAAYGSLAIAIAIPATAVCLYAIRNAVSHRPVLGVLWSAIGQSNQHGSLGGEVSYIWQYYLPRLPGMANDFPGIFTPYQVWFERLVGLYGWLDTYFSVWVDRVALIAVALIAVLCARALIVSRAALRARAGELLAYAVMSLGVLGLVGSSAYLAFPERAGGFSEPRYLLPMTVLFAAALALAARGAGRRWGPAVGALLVLLILAHDIFSQLLVVGRYYV